MKRQMATFDDITDPRADPYSKDSLTVEADSGHAHSIIDGI